LDGRADERDTMVLGNEGLRRTTVGVFIPSVERLLG